MRKFAAAGLIAIGIVAFGGSGTVGAESVAVRHWFDAGRCATFDGDPGIGSAPVLKRDATGVIFDSVTENTRGYFYDPVHRYAERYPETDSDATFTLRVSGPPPPGVPNHDLGRLHTASGMKLGTRSETVVRLLGKPEIIKGCGLQRYVYLRSRDGEPTTLEFTIDHGHVTEIFEEFGG